LCASIDAEAGNTPFLKKKYLLDEKHEARYFSKIDLRSGQIDTEVWLLSSRSSKRIYGYKDPNPLLLLAYIVEAGKMLYTQPYLNLLIIMTTCHVIRQATDHATCTRKHS
jgi:hypothetical protein